MSSKDTDAPWATPLRANDPTNSLFVLWSLAVLIIPIGVLVYACIRKAHQKRKRQQDIEGQGLIRLQLRPSNHQSSSQSQRLHPSDVAGSQSPASAVRAPRTHPQMNARLSKPIYHAVRLSMLQPPTTSRLAAQSRSDSRHSPVSPESISHTKRYQPDSPVSPLTPTPGLKAPEPAYQPSKRSNMRGVETIRTRRKGLRHHDLFVTTNWSVGGAINRGKSYSRSQKKQIGVIRKDVARSKSDGSQRKDKERGAGA